MFLAHLPTNCEKCSVKFDQCKPKVYCSICSTKVEYTGERMFACDSPPPKYRDVKEPSPISPLVLKLGDPPAYPFPDQVGIKDSPIWVNPNPSDECIPEGNQLQEESSWSPGFPEYPYPLLERQDGYVEAGSYGEKRKASDSRSKDDAPKKRRKSEKVKLPSCTPVCQCLLCSEFFRPGQQQPRVDQFMQLAISGRLTEAEWNHVRHNYREFVVHHLRKKPKRSILLSVMNMFRKKFKN